MARQILLSNGDLVAGLDSYGQVQELYYPNTSSGNHVGNGSLRHKIGVYCENAVHWLDDGAWKVQQAYYPGRLISRTIANNLWLDMRLEIQDYVDSELDVLVRNIHVVNLSRRSRQVKLFLHQGFVINNNPRGVGTAQYMPANVVKGLSLPTLLHYYSDTAFAVSGQCCNNADGFTEFSIGHFGKYDGNFMSGVWCDAADGMLSGNLHETGHTDSIMGFDMQLAPHDSAYVNYYLAAGQSAASAAHNLRKFLHEGIESRTKRTAEHWLEWLEPAVNSIRQKIEPSRRYEAIDVLINLRATMSNSGAVSSFSPDITDNNAQPVIKPVTAAAVASTFARVGLDIDTARIFNFLATAVERDGCILPSYLANGSAGPSGYYFDDMNEDVIMPISVLDTASALCALCRTIHIVAPSKTIPADWRKLWTRLGKPLANFLTDYIDPVTKLPKASFGGNRDHPSTTNSDIAAVYIALSMAAQVAERVKNTDDVIKYQTVASDIQENAHELWSGEDQPASNIVDVVSENNSTHVDQTLAEALKAIRLLDNVDSNSETSL